jgi:hypothetical protein
MLIRKGLSLRARNPSANAHSSGGISGNTIPASAGAKASSANISCYPIPASASATLTASVLSVDISTTILRLRQYMVHSPSLYSSALSSA